MTTTRIPRSIAAGLTAAIAAAGLASAAQASDPNDPALAVPQGKIEHTVRLVEVSGTRAAHDRTERQELYLASDKARMIVRHSKTGRLISELAFAKGKTSFFDAQANVLDTFGDRSDKGVPYQSLAQQADVWRDALAAGATAQVGETTVGGRAALVLQSVKGRWTSDVPSDVTKMVVDKETFTPYSITSSPGPEFTQTVTLRSTEMLDRTAATEKLLAMGRHPGAKSTKAGTAKSKKAKSRKAVKGKKGAARR